MKLTKVDALEASMMAVRTLGLDADAIDLVSPEAIAASLRRAASFFCPTSPSRLVDAVLGALHPLRGEEVSRDDVSELLDLLIAAGDLLELRHGSSQATRLLYLAPPSYIERVPGEYILMGIRPFGAPLIAGELANGLQFHGHTRTLDVDNEDAEEHLRLLGLRRLRRDRWVASPAKESPERFIAGYCGRLEIARPAGHLDGLQLLDPSSSVRYYRGRWRTPASSDDGDFITRRPQAYGADLWCLARFKSGVPQRLLELPIGGSIAPARDEAWRYQAAIDALRGNPQRFRVRCEAGEGTDTLDFFSPLPGFAERYVQLSGHSLGKTKGALFSYQVPAAARADISNFLTNMLWMAQEEAPSGV